MITKVDAQKLAKLARLEIKDDELEKISNEIGSVLEYIDKIKSVNVPENLSHVKNPTVLNVIREDENSHNKGIYTQKILKEAPETENNQIKVKKIL